MQLISVYSVYNNHLIMEDFNLEPNDSCMKSFLNRKRFTNLIKTNTCFKGLCIDLILTNRKNSFQYTRSYDTGLSGHNLMTYIMLKTAFMIYTMLKTAFAKQSC